MQAVDLLELMTTYDLRKNSVQVEVEEFLWVQKQSCHLPLAVWTPKLVGQLGRFQQELTLVPEKEILEGALAIC